MQLLQAKGSVTVVIVIILTWPSYQCVHNRIQFTRKHKKLFLTDIRALFKTFLTFSYLIHLVTYFLP